LNVATPEFDRRQPGHDRIRSCTGPDS